jgi:deazaflavin-dependent oxidoreductase (nitroreductase family)
MSSYDENLIAEYRKTGGNMGGRSLLLLTTIGAKSGQERVKPLAYTTDNERYIIIASKAGAPDHPAWYYNILANPVMKVEIGSETFQVRASVAQGQERERLFANMVAQMPQFAEYQQKTSRQLPVIILERI